MYKVNIKPVRIVVLLSTQKQNNVVPYQGNITIRDWSKSMVGGGGGGGDGPDHLEMWLIKNLWPTPPFSTKMTHPPLKRGWKLHDPPPS